MPDEPNRQPKPRTQPTKPKEGEPVEIPVPKVSTIRAALRKVAQPTAPDPDDERGRD